MSIMLRNRKYWTAFTHGTHVDAKGATVASRYQTPLDEWMPDYPTRTCDSQKDAAIADAAAKHCAYTKGWEGFQLERAIHRGRVPSITVDAHLTLTQYISGTYLPYLQKRGANLAGLKSMLDLLDRELGTVELHHLSAQMILAFVDRLKAGKVATKVRTHKGALPPKRSATTCDRYLQLLRAMLRRAEQLEIIAKSPWSGKASLLLREAFSPKTEGRKRRVTATEEDAFLAVADVDMQDRWRFAVGVGLRRGTMQKLQWQDISLAKGTLRIEPSKDKAKYGRTIPLPHALIAILQRRRATLLTALYPHATPIDAEAQLALKYVFGTELGTYQFDFDKKVASIIADVQRDQPTLFHDWTWHDLRGEAVSRMREAGHVREDIMKITGHKRAETLDRFYEGDITEHLRTVVEATQR